MKRGTVMVEETDEYVASKKRRKNKDTRRPTPNVGGTVALSVALFALSVYIIVTHGS
jgi:hypothetical protein